MPPTEPPTLAATGFLCEALLVFDGVPDADFDETADAGFVVAVVSLLVVMACDEEEGAVVLFEGAVQESVVEGVSTTDDEGSIQPYWHPLLVKQ